MTSIAPRASSSPFERRRDFLKALTALATAGFPLPNLFAADPAASTGFKMLGGRQPFDYAWLKGQARAVSTRPFRSTADHIPDPLKDLDWDQYQAIGYRADHALWGKDGVRFQMKFFHLGLFYKMPVRMFEVVDGQAQELAYDPVMFDYRASGVDGSRLPRDLGFAGFQLLYHTDPLRDIVAFLGASYFRAVGAEMQYGISARGLAVDTGMARAEEFPAFTAFWLERPPRDSGRVFVYALMDSPSVAGAYRFIINPAPTLVMDVDAALYPRTEIERLGVAPLTSMFLHGENDRRVANDWRPEIHDSDGLAMWTGAGEWIWRPVVNPGTVRISAFSDENPRGFGLLQRDRNFDHYQDDGVFYERRPSLWVEPKSGWGKGSVQLVELPTTDETFDNIVVFWNPMDRPNSGQELLFGYRLHWGSKMPVNPPFAQVLATRTGIGGIVGQKRKYFSWRFVVDFAGDNLAMIGRNVKVEPVITASRGRIELTSARPLDSVGGYRAMFDLRPGDSSLAPVDLRLYLRADGKPLTETWLYQWTPPEQHAS
jgi:glucans biosynthesis protein